MDDCLVYFFTGFLDSGKTTFIKETLRDPQFLSGGKLLTDGGRVLVVTATADTLPDALREAYAAVSRIHFDNAFYRHDIGARALKIMEES